MTNLHENEKSYFNFMPLDGPIELNIEKKENYQNNNKNIFLTPQPKESNYSLKNQKSQSELINEIVPKSVVSNVKLINISDKLVEVNNILTINSYL